MDKPNTDLPEVQRALDNFVDQVFAAVGAVSESGLVTTALVQEHTRALTTVADRLLAVTFANAALLAALRDHVDLDRVRTAAQTGLMGHAAEDSAAPRMLDELFDVICTACDFAREPDAGPAPPARH